MKYAVSLSIMLMVGAMLLFEYLVTTLDLLALSYLDQQKCAAPWKKLVATLYLVY